MDAIDRRILEALREDARATNAAIGREVGLTEAAVRRRIQLLVADRTIQRFTISTVPLGPEGLVLIRCRPGRTADILREVALRAAEVFESSGEFDLGAQLECSTMEELNSELDRIRALDGVEETVTLIRLARVAPTPRAHRRARESPASARSRPSASSRSARGAVTAQRK